MRRVGPAVAAALFALAIACGAPDPTATGIVIAVDGPNVAEVDAFTLRTSEGVVLEFTVTELSLTGGGKAAPHLREHMASGAPIVVEYRADGGRLLALRYTDAP